MRDWKIATQISGGQLNGSPALIEGGDIERLMGQF